MFHRYLVMCLFCQNELKGTIARALLFFFPWKRINWLHGSVLAWMRDFPSAEITINIVADMRQHLGPCRGDSLFSTVHLSASRQESTGTAEETSSSLGPASTNLDTCYFHSLFFWKADAQIPPRCVLWCESLRWADSKFWSFMFTAINLLW